MEETSIDYLIVSYASLPLPRPRSYQIAKLLTHLKGKFLLLTGEYTKLERLDLSLGGYQKNVAGNTTRIKDKFESSIGSFLFSLIPALNKLPDKHLFWTLFLTRHAKKLKERVKPKAIIAFARPHSNLLIGVKLKKIFDAPLIVHFSDPWVDNPYVKYSSFLKWANSIMEYKVVRKADLILFTNEDQQKLVMRKYPLHIQEKARHIAHCYDESLYCAEKMETDKFVIRHIGNLYKQRSPEPFLKAVHHLIENYPDLQNQFLIEFYGQISEEIHKSIEAFSLEHTVKVKASVPYLESLKLMARSDLLLLIDAESSHNSFFPSKLVDYIGAKKMIMGITSPTGPSARIIQSYGGSVFSHDQVGSMKEFLFTCVKQKKEFHPNVNELMKYSASNVAAEFEEMVKQVMNKNDLDGTTECAR